MEGITPYPWPSPSIPKIHWNRRLTVGQGSENLLRGGFIQAILFHFQESLVTTSKRMFSTYNPSLRVLVSEALLFVSFFWTSFHSLSSITLGIISHEAFYLPDPCELTFANTLLLSNAAISLGITFTSLEISSLFYISLSFTLCSLFISLQGKEFRILALLINDSLYSCLFFAITGLHFFHLVYGLLLLSLLFWSCSFSYSLLVGYNSKRKTVRKKKRFS